MAEHNKSKSTGAFYQADVLPCTLSLSLRQGPHPDPAAVPEVRLREPPAERGGPLQRGTRGRGVRLRQPGVQFNRHLRKVFPIGLRGGYDARLRF